MKKISITILFIFGILFSPSFLKANGADVLDPQTSIGVNPAIVEVVMDQDNSGKQEIDVLNLTDTAIPIRTTKEGFSLAEKSDVPQDKIDIYDASSWITLSDDDTDFILKPKEIKTITLEIKEPENSSPGGHYATVYFQGLTRADQIDNNSADINIKIGVLVLIQVPGNIVDEIRIKDFSSDGSSSNTSNLTFNLQLENTGNVHLIPTGKINIYNDLNNELIKTFSLDNRLILPGLVNSYSFNIDPGYQIGRVSAQAEIMYGPANKTLESEKRSVTIFPFMYLGIALILLFFIIIFRKRIIKAVKVLFNRRANSNETIS